MRIVHHDLKHDLKIYSLSYNLFRLDHGEEIIVENCDPERIKKVYNKIVDFHNKAGINYEEKQ